MRGRKRMFTLCVSCTRINAKMLFYVPESAHFFVSLDLIRGRAYLDYYYKFKNAFQVCAICGLNEKSNFLLKLNLCNAVCISLGIAYYSTSTRMYCPRFGSIERYETKLTNLIDLTIGRTFLELIAMSCNSHRNDFL